jgi:hypothetical protein
MSAFPNIPVIGPLNYLRKIAMEYNCNPCFDGKDEEIQAMDEKGKDGVLYCLCKIDAPCKPCDEFLNTKKCYCEMFKELEK